MMKYIIYAILLCFLLCCQSELKKKDTSKEITNVKHSTSNFNDPYYYAFNDNKNEIPYKLSLNLNKLNDIEYLLNIEIQLKKDAFFASLNSKEDYKGKLKIDFPENDCIQLVSKLNETPLSKTISNNDLSDWVKDTTMYHQKFSIKTKDNFKTSGVIRFVIEPRCTLEEIGIILIYENGELRLERDMC